MNFVAQLAKNLPTMWETWARSLGWEDPLEKGKATHSSTLWRIPRTIIHGVANSWTQLSDFHFTEPLLPKEIQGEVPEIQGEVPASLWSHFLQVVKAAEKAMAPTPVLLPGKSRDGGAWWAAVHGVAKSWTRLKDFTFTFHFHALQKEMATHSSVLAWRNPGTAEPGGLLSMGSHRVGHD